MSSAKTGYELYIDLLRQCLQFFPAEFLCPCEIKDAQDMSKKWFRPDNKFIMAQADAIVNSIRTNGMFLPFIITPDKFIIEGQHRLDALHRSNCTDKFLSIYVKDRLNPKALKYGKLINPPISVKIPQRAIGGNLLRLITEIADDTWEVDSQTVLIHLLVDFGEYLKEYTWDNKETLTGHPIINDEVIFNAGI